MDRILKTIMIGRGGGEIEMVKTKSVIHDPTTECEVPGTELSRSTTYLRGPCAD